MARLVALSSLALSVIASRAPDVGAPKGHMQIYPCDPTNPNQIFDYTANFTLRGRKSDLCITATTGGAAASPLWPAPCVDNDPSQAFTFEGNGHVRLINTTACNYQPCAAGTCCECFDVLGGGVASGTELALYPCATPTASNEKFEYNPSTGLLLGVSSGLCADAGTIPPRPLLASYFHDHMVLQRNTPTPVWGFAPPAATIQVIFRNNSYGPTTADANGTWRLALPAMPANAVGSTLSAMLLGSSALNQTIVDVLIGDVYIASGQCACGVTSDRGNAAHRIFLYPQPTCSLQSIQPSTLAPR